MVIVEYVEQGLARIEALVVISVEKPNINLEVSLTFGQAGVSVPRKLQIKKAVGLRFGSSKL